MTASAERSATAKNSSRRALLAGALGGIGAVAAGAVGRVNPVRGANNDPVLVGNSHTGSAPTQIVNSTNDETVIGGISSNGGIGVFGASSTYAGLYGSSVSSYGVVGDSSNYFGVYGVTVGGYGVVGNASTNIGVYGLSSASGQPAVLARSTGHSTGLLGSSGTGFPAAKPKTGVYGYANQDANSKGVWGFSGTGAGVLGQANKNGYALRGKGRVRFDKVSGVATIPAGSTGVTVSLPVNVTSGAFVLLTPRSNIGSRALWYVPNPAQDNFRIRISSSRSSATKVAWLLLG